MRIRNVELVLWSNDELINKVQILEDNKIPYAYILHDKDVDDDGSLKKPHYHLRIFDDNQRTPNAWCTLLDVKEHELQYLENKRRAIRYLIHLDSPNKYQYSENDIVTNLLDIDNYFNQDKVEESTQLQNIFDYIENIRGYIYFKEVKSYVIQNNYWSSYRRYYSIIKDVILEHNKYCIDYMLN